MCNFYVSVKKKVQPVKPEITGIQILFRDKINYIFWTSGGRRYTVCRIIGLRLLS